MGMRARLCSIPESEIESLQADPDQIATLLASRVRTESYVHLEKSWHGIHYVLTGTSWEGAEPLNFLLLGGEPIGDADDEESSPPRLFDPDFVHRLNVALTPITIDEFDRRFDLDQLEAEEIYPGIWDEDREELLDEYLTYFESIKQLVARAAQNNEAIVIVID